MTSSNDSLGFQGTAGSGSYHPYQRRARSSRHSIYSPISIPQLPIGLPPKPLRVASPSSSALFSTSTRIQAIRQPIPYTLPLEIPSVTFSDPPSSPSASMQTSRQPKELVRHLMPKLQTQADTTSASRTISSNGFAPTYLRSDITSTPRRFAKMRAAPLSRESCRPGMVLRAALHEGDLHRRNRDSVADSKSDTSFRGELSATRMETIYSQVRHMIVVAIFATHYLAIPLYTHGGRGLDYKEDKDEYISVHDTRSGKRPQQLSMHEPLKTGDMNPEMRELDPLSTAYFTYPISRKYCLHAYHEGDLEAESTMQLVDLYRTFMVLGSLSKQEQANG